MNRWLLVVVLGVSVPAWAGDITFNAGTGSSGSGDITDVNEGTAIDVTNPTGPAPSVAFDSTEVEGTTWGAGGNASNTWTFNLSGTDPTITFASGTVTGPVVAASTGFEVNGERVTDWTGSGITIVGGALTASAAGGSNSFETIDVPAGTDPVADSSTDTLTITETSPLALTGTSGTDTIDITVDAGADFDGSGLIEANAVALGTDTTNAYVADLTAGLAIDVSGGGAETATVTVDFDPTELTGSRTWGDASTDTIVWTWDRATGTDPLLGFGSGSMTVTGSLVVETSFQLPFGTGPTINQSGELAFETTSGQLVVFNNTANREDVVSTELNKCATIENLVAADDNVLLYIFEDAATIRRTNCTSISMTTLPTYQLEDGNGNAVTGASLCTGNPDKEWTTVTSGHTFIRGETLRVDTTNTPAPTTGTFTTVCWVYTLDRR